MINSVAELDPDSRREHQRKIAQDSLERYSGSHIDEYQPYLLITNFPQYVRFFAESRGTEVKEGSMFSVAHSEKEQVSILDFKIGSPAAALVIDCCAFLPFRACLHLGMCGGLRRHYQVGDYFVPVASIRGEGTSDFYFPSEVPAMANFLVQKYVTNTLEEAQKDYHIGICHTTNKRFWEFKLSFIERLKESMAQAIDMESATLFCASYRYKLPTGAFYIISDLPLNLDGIKTKKSSSKFLDNHMEEHVNLGVKMMQSLGKTEKLKVKGVFRGKYLKD